ncbi:DegT/DnrJ/EryC1/StrS family aminotransferase [Halobacteriovorax sp. JY17]|uniref:DegT/DnrJ/EryC1/StrS family aminotransferase n=1 Tax=Halobacteriovorax sp. JY17 TaxID=2014617 RepID=UPI000C440568|nr:DegT/DnrJ/EryC1/StrS family aminotransferase [Halobacteriovorax sp. JY17]PIK14708.1 MAG: pyridoxamine 5-phosphate oxidase [Halobacteriovorax sp. JY17]
METENSFPLALSSWDHEEIDAINAVIKSDRYSMGQYVEQFEEDFSKYIGAKYCVMVNSGSTSNLIAIASLFYRKENPLKKGDEVIVPAVSWSTTYTPLQQYGLKVKFVDIDKDTLNYDLDALSTAISDNTKLIVAVNLLGNSNDFDRINEIIANKDIIIYEDNCESLGAKFNGKMAGTFGLLGGYSTFFSHHMSTMEGGLITTDDEELYHIMLSLRSHGWTRHLPKENLVTGTKSDNPFEESFKFVLPGYNVRPVEMSGAIGIAQLKKLPKFIEERRENANYFKEQFSSSKYFHIQAEVGESSWFGFALTLKDDTPFERSELIAFLEKNKIECRPVVTGNFTKNEVIKYFDYEIHGELKNADRVDTKSFFVGNHHVDMKKAIDLLQAKVEEFVNLKL